MQFRDEFGEERFGARVRRFVAYEGDRRLGDLAYADYDGRWLLQDDASGDAPADVVRALVEHVVERAREAGARIVVSRGTEALFDPARFEDVLEAPPPARDEVNIVVEPPRELRAFLRLVSNRLDALARLPPRDKEDRRLSLAGSRGEAFIPSFDITSANVTWWPEGADPRALGWTPMRCWEFRADRPLLERAAKAGEVLNVREIRYRVEPRIQREGARDVLDDLVSDGTVVLVDEPEGSRRTLAVAALGARVTPLLVGARGLATRAERDAFATRLIEWLLSQPEIDDVFASDRELRERLEQTLWGPSRESD